MVSLQPAPTLVGDMSKPRRLILRPRRPSDADALFSTMADPDAMRWWSRAPFKHVEELRAYFVNDDQSNWRSWAIVRAGEELAVGFVAAGQKREGVSEIGYLLARAAQGHGYAHEAVTILIDHLFAEGQRRIFADTDPDNHPSIALLTALGFTLEGRLRAEWHTHIGVRDSLIYGLLAEEWSSGTGGGPAS
ncbi:N-acetyltransferase GCN5 [Gluconacetobacter sacchari DSM 12717]|nr:N-acetyltransferase GCN5 [Gluconacetobacter sacchari DSM 12717]